MSSKAGTGARGLAPRAKLPCMDAAHADPVLPTSSPPRTDDARYEAIRERDPAADSAFVYAVSTTGIFCRPTCGARLALRRHVRFFADPASAQAAGFRACKRCRPTEAAADEREAALVAHARELLIAGETASTWPEIAAAVGVSPAHLHRAFKRRTGLTPREYARAERLVRLREGLADGQPVTVAVHDAGYGSSSRFYERDASALGMSPADARRGGRGVELAVHIGRCELGRLLVARSTRGVAAIALGEDDTTLHAELRTRFPHATWTAADEALVALTARVATMIDEAAIDPTLPLDLVGTAFQLRVWTALRAIPRGETTSYAAIAEAIGAPSAVRAVGTACGRNPVAIAVPCHRVLRQDGELGGYRWGLERKRALLAREQRPPAAAKNK